MENGLGAGKRTIIFDHVVNDEPSHEWAHETFEITQYPRSKWMLTAGFNIATRPSSSLQI